MALVVFLRGVNVGGHRTFRPTLLVERLKHLDVVNIGAAGTFVVRKPVTRARLRAELLRGLPFDAHIMIVQGREIVAMMDADPFSGQATSVRPRPIRQRAGATARVAPADAAQPAPGRPMGTENHRAAGGIRLRRVPAQHGGDTASQCDRPALRSAGDDAQLEYDDGGREGRARSGAPGEVKRRAMTAGLRSLLFR
jgi:hypothetical protein